MLLLGDAVKKCARDIHDECAQLLVEKTPVGDLCSNVGKFVSCYNDAVGVEPPEVPESCSGRIPGISATFNTVIQKFSTYLINIYMGETETMCTVDSGELEGDCINM